MRRALRVARVALVALSALVLLVAVVFLVSLTLPVKAWRTGEPPTPRLALAPGQQFAGTFARVWIDTDAACGHDRRADPDDCFAILLLVQADDIEIVGISSVFGNVPLPIADQTTRSLVAELKSSGFEAPPVYRGSSEPMNEGAPTTRIPAHEMLRAALEKGPLAIVALGPMTNIATTLRERPELQANVTRLVAVMGRRRGHLFHPVEGGTARSVLGHGPVFRDFNFTKDEEATAVVLATGMPVTLVPYEAARDVMIGDDLLDKMAARNGAAAWVAQHARDWLAYWREDIDRKGFYPFDLIAAAYSVKPSLLRCAHAKLSVEDDVGVLGWLGFEGLFVLSAEERASDPIATGHALYCPEAAPHLGEWLSGRLARRQLPVSAPRAGVLPRSSSHRQTGLATRR